MPSGENIENLLNSPDRDEKVNLLLNSNELPALYEFLEGEFTRWNYKTGTKEDLAWLYRVMLRTMEHSRNNSASLSLEGPGRKITVTSKAFLGLLMDETLLAAALAWVRCFRGPGGDNICREMLFVLQEGKLCEAILEILAEDPLAMALHWENYDLKETGCNKSGIVSMLARSVLASEYSFSSLVKVCLDIAGKEPETAIELKKLLEPVLEKISALYGAPGENLFKHG